MATHKCLFCQNEIGLRRFIDSSYCSTAHAKADAEQMRNLTLNRLRSSAERFREALEKEKEMEREKQLLKARLEAEAPMIFDPTPKRILGERLLIAAPNCDNVSRRTVRALVYR